MEPNERDTDGIFAATIRPALVSTLFFVVLCGLAYPLATTGAAQILFPGRAAGSLVERDGELVGSRLIAQKFTEPEYFHPRPSVTLDNAGAEPLPYNAANSRGSNYGATNAALVEEVEERAAEYRFENGLPDDALVPVDAVTASSSGLDPHITLANADSQTARVAESRGIPADEVRALVAKNTDGRLLGFIGEPGVNVLELNLALDDAGGR